MLDIVHDAALIPALSELPDDLIQLANRVLPGQMRLRERLVDDDDRRSVDVVASCEFAARFNGMPSVRK